MHSGSGFGSGSDKNVMTKVKKSKIKEMTSFWATALLKLK
jgi:hypothetical protein